MAEDEDSAPDLNAPTSDADQRMMNAGVERVPKNALKAHMDRLNDRSAKRDPAAPRPAAPTPQAESPVGSGITVRGLPKTPADIKTRYIEMLMEKAQSNDTLDLTLLDRIERLLGYAPTEDA